MLTIERFQKIAIALISIFFFGMIWQFLTHTVVMYGLHLPPVFEFIWLWKEVIIGVLGAGSIYMMRKYPLYRDKFLHHRHLMLIIGALILSFVISMANSLIIHHQSIVTFLISAKFNYIPLFVLCSGILVSQILTSEQYDKIIHTIIKTIQYVLVFSLIWYIIINTIPNILDRIGFAQPGDSIEWIANRPPPSLYLTEFYSGYVRNQGPFGGPLSLGFYLVALRPLFFAKVLYQKKLSDTRGRRLLYISMAISTYSRAAWLMFFVSCAAIALIIYRRYTKHIFGLGLASVVGVLVYIKSGGSSEIFVRTRSDKGHIELFAKGIELIQQYWLWGMGAASVGPGSNHIAGIKEVFNPENQYMQIWLEYGLFGLLGWGLVYIMMIKNSIKNRCIGRRDHKTYQAQDLMFIGIGISVISLSIAGMVLHPFIDSSSMYPFMLYAGLVLGTYKDNTISTVCNIDKTIQQQKEHTKNKINKALLGRQIWTIIIGLLFTAQTILVSGRSIVDNTIIISTVRDILFASIVLLTGRQHRQYLLSFIVNNKTIVGGTLLLLTTNIVYILGHLHTDIIHNIAGMKYDIYCIIILISSLRLGHICYNKHQGNILTQYITRFGKFILVLIGSGLMRQIAKTISPEFFVQYLGFSTPSDFLPFAKPPIYYITGSGGIQRLSGFFVGPNTLGFFMIVCSSFLYYRYKNMILQRRYRWIIILYIIIGLSTLSRGVTIAMTLQALIIVFFEPYIIGASTGYNILSKHFYTSKKLMLGGIIILMSIISFWSINQRKQDSNTERFGALESSLALVSDIPLFGHGPGYVGPAKHYDQDYTLHQKNNLSMLENIYLQILINQGIRGITIFIGILVTLGQYHNKIRLLLRNNNTLTTSQHTILMTTQYLGIGLLSLLSIGRFLHIFIDSMVNYLFFVIYGVSLGYVRAYQYE